MSSSRKSQKEAPKVLKSVDGETELEVCKSFNKIIRKLVKTLYILSKKSLKVDSLKNQLSAAIQEDSFIIIKEAGPGIYEHRKLIQDRVEDFFSKVDFQAKYGHTNGLKNNMDLFLLVKQKWPKMTQEEKNSIGDDVQNLLDQYMKYLLFQKIKNGNITPDQVGYKYE
jgi:hypothetical protein